MPAIKGRTPAWSGFPWRSPLGIGLLLSFFLPILVLAAVSAISLRQRSETRSLLVQERYGAIADLVSTKLDEQMDLGHRQLLAAIEGEDWSEEAVVARLHSAEPKFPELTPLVMVAADGRALYPVRARVRRDPGAALSYGLGVPTTEQGTFGWLIARGQEAEMRDQNPEGAVRLYRRALGTASTLADRTRAINAMARAQTKVGDTQTAIESYRRLVETADPMDTELSRWAIIGRVQLAAVQASAGQSEAACSGTLDTLRFLQRYRFHLDPDVYAFYRAHVESSLAHHDLTEEQHQQLLLMLAREADLNDADRALEGLMRELPQLIAARSTDWSRGDESAPSEADTGESPDRLATNWSVTYQSQIQGSGTAVLSRRMGTEFHLARVWRPSSVKAVLAWLLEQDGPWRSNGVALYGPSGGVFFASTDAVPLDHITARLPLTALPGWRIAAYPVDGSIAAEARQDVVDYAVLLGAAFLAVVASLVLATRTLSREVALARTRSDFVSNVSHELKTPLALIRMFAENLRSGWVSEGKKPEYYRVMLGESERLSGIIDNVLDFSRIESGHREFHFRATDLTELVSDIVERYRYSFDASVIELVAELPEEPVEARVDRDSISQVLVNLLSNAAKYIGDGDKRVQVELLSGDEDVAIVVRDSGIGMSRDGVEKIFAPFCRIDDPAVGSVAGSGIGLTIVRHIVEAHRGSIEVMSSPGDGSTFRVVLPRDPRTRRHGGSVESRTETHADG